MCIAQQLIDLFEWIYHACEDSAVSVWTLFIRLGDLMSGGAEYEYLDNEEEMVYIPQRNYFFL